MRKIFVSAYACEPGKGSEIGVGWHWVFEMSKYYELWVMTRANNQQPIEAYYQEHPEDNRGIHWVYFDLPDWIKKFKKGMRGVRIYYTLWQHGADTLVKKTMQENDVHIFHLLTYGNTLWHVSKYGQKQFFIWGPTGGVDTIPGEYSKQYGFRNRAVEFVRRCVVKSLPINYGFKQRCKNADLILCKAQSTISAIPEKYQKKACQFTDVASDISVEDYEQTFDHPGRIEYLVVGRLDAWRGFDLLIEAFAQAVKLCNQIHLTIVGEGSDKRRLRGLIQRLNLEEYIDMVGEVPMEMYREYMKKSDVVVNPCLKEGAVTVSFDAMSYGKPFICIDTGGYTKYFTNNYAIVLPRNSRLKTISNLAEAIVKTTNPMERKRLSLAISEISGDVAWDVKGKQIRELFEKSFCILDS